MEKNNPLDLLTIGDVCIDLYMKVEGREVSEDKDPQHPKICFYHGSKIPVKSVMSNIAGNAVNVSIGATKLGLNTAIYTEMGDDEEADRIEKELAGEGINTHYLHRNKNVLTGIHPVIVYQGERTIFSHHEERPYHVHGWPKPKWLYYTSVGPGFESFQKDLVEYIKSNPDVGVAFNPGTFHVRSGLEGIKNILEVTHVLFLNKDEAENFVGDGSLEDMHLKLQKLGPKLTVITEGDKGASAYDGKELIKVPAYEMDQSVIDKTGAGDSFAAGFVSALSHGKSLEEALHWGTINSSSVIREIGAVHGLKTKQEIEKLVQAL
jgi:sugar/nucleoside kinase (ribokinase family)